MKITRLLSRNPIINFFFFALILFAGYIIFHDLGKAPLENYDEAWYADVTRTMLRTKEFIALYWNKSLFLDKPPLYMWFSALFATIFGLNEFSFRLTSAIAAMIIVIMILLYTYKQYGLVPSLFAFSTITFNSVFIWRARSGNLDILVTFLIFLTYFVMVSKNKHRYVILGILFGVIYLAKLSLVFIPLAVFGLHELFFQLKNIKKNFMSYIFLSVIFLGIAGAWLYAGDKKVGNSFSNYYLYQADQGVSKISLQNFKKDYIEHTYYALQRRYYWVFLLGLLLLLTKIKKPEHFTLILFSTLLIIQLSFTQRNNNWYLIPSMPFWSIVIAYAAYRIIQFSRQSIIVIVIMFAAHAFLSYRAYVVNIIPVSNSYGPVKLKESGLKLHQLSGEKNTIVRLDYFYPTLAYYSERKVIYFPLKDEQNHIPRHIMDLINERKIQWASGVKGDVEIFVKELGKIPYKVTNVNDEEEIVKLW